MASTIKKSADLMNRKRLKAGRIINVVGGDCGWFGVGVERAKVRPKHDRTDSVASQKESRRQRAVMIGV
jgi:hypothetical protein